MLDRLDFATRTPSGNLLLRLLRDFGRDHVRGYLLAAIFLGLIALSNVSVAWLLRPVLNGMVSAEKLAQMRFLAFEALALFVLRGAATFGSMVILSRIGNRIVATAQRRVFERLLNQNIAYFQDRHSSEFIARLAFAANGVRDALQLVIQGFARDLVSVTGLVFVMVARDPKMALGALLALPVAAFFVSRILRRVREFAKRSYEGSTQIVQTMGETVLGARIVRSFNLEGEMRERMSRAIRTVERSANRIARGGGLVTFLADSLAGCAIAFAIFYGSWRVAVQHADVGAFASFLGLERQRGSWSRQKPRYADRLSGLFAVAVTAVVDHAQRFLDLLQELALPVPGAQFECVLFFERSPIRRIGRNLVLAQMLAGIVGIVQQLRSKFEQALSEERQLRLVHIVALRRLQQVLLAKFLDLFYCRFCCHAPTFPLGRRYLPARHVAV